MCKAFYGVYISLYMAICALFQVTVFQNDRH